jgi:hypothetical protein
MSELSIHELEAETGEVLPARETLGVNTSHDHIFAFNTSLAVDYKTFLSNVHSTATQTITL